MQLPDEVKRQLIWTNIGKTITVSGAGVFHKLTTILSETPHCFEISNQLNGTIKIKVTNITCITAHIVFASYSMIVTGVRNDLGI